MLGHLDDLDFLDRVEFVLVAQLGDVYALHSKELFMIFD
jgi:hypothetical protein